MRISRVYSERELDIGSRIDLDLRSAHYVSRVLRASPEDRLVLFNGDGFDYACRVTHIGRGEVEVEILEKRENHCESPINLTLVQAISRGERMDQCLQKSTELGVSQIFLLHSERVEVKLSDKRLEKRMAHWRSVIISACEQCGRAVVPQLHAPVPLSQWQAKPQALVLDPASPQTLAGVRLKAPLAIVVGPEGGFAGHEIARLRECGVIPVSLGPRVLRTETAGPTAIAILQSMLGDLR